MPAPSPHALSFAPSCALLLPVPPASAETAWKFDFGSGGAVRLKDREKPRLHWEDKSALEFNRPRHVRRHVDDRRIL